MYERPCSEVLVHGGELVIFSADQRLEYGECGIDCMVVNSTRMPGSGKLTSIPISGERHEKSITSMLVYSAQADLDSRALL